jgi:anti-anti-sigma factor
MPDGHVTHAERNGVHVLRYSGRISYTSAPAIHRFLQVLLAKRGLRGLVFDLTAAENLDSTNVGLIARTADSVRTSSGARSLVVSTNGDVTSVLQSMCLDDIVELVTDAPVGMREAAVLGGEKEIEAERPSEEELRGVMLDAHRALVNLSETGRITFQDVVDLLEKGSKTLS